MAERALPPQGTASVAPPTPQSTDPDELGFEPRPMVGWFRPKELVRAGLKALLSGLFGAYADYREVQAALRKQDCFDLSDGREIWIDFVADVGDGFDSTYAVARALAEEELVVGGHPTRRGRLLVLGGDEVYPTATQEEYLNRLEGPYRAALPWVPEDRAPSAFAVPGNHDWYDGLTSFTRLFCQGRWLGGWKTRQCRSYFAVKLLPGWWLWGIDVQLGSDVDLPQYEYFERMASERMEPGSRVILCTAEPSWVFTAMHGPEAYRNLGFFEKKCLHPWGHQVVVGLAGDLHAYARYQEEGGDRQRLVAGGGGAYLYPTHDLPKRLDLPSEAGGSGCYERAAVYPAVAHSRRRSLGSLLFPWKNRGFALLLGSIYTFYAWIWQSASVLAEGGSGGSLLQQLAELNRNLAFRKIFGIFRDSVAHSPESILLLAILFAGLIGFADHKSMVWKFVLGGLHGLAHLVVLLVSMWFFACINLVRLRLELESVSQVVLFGAEMLLIGGGVGGLVMGLYLLAANLTFRSHTNEIFSCQHIPDCKHFLRLHLEAPDRLTLYPIALDRVPRWRRGGWRLAREAKDGRSWFEPADRPIAEYVRLIEGPVRLGEAPGGEVHG